MTGTPPSDLLRALPHGPAARLLDSVVEVDDDSILCRAVTRKDSPYGDGSTVSALIAVEMGAQAAAAHQVFLRSRSGGERPASGYVVRARKLTIGRERLDPPDPVGVRARLIGSAGSLCVYSVTCHLEHGPELLAVELSLFHRSNG